MYFGDLGHLLFLKLQFFLRVGLEVGAKGSVSEDCFMLLFYMKNFMCRRRVEVESEVGPEFATEVYAFQLM